MDVSAVVPAYNEAERISDVIKALYIEPVDEIIVADDGSTDGTGQMAESLGVNLVRSSKNRGKARALTMGVEAAENEDIIFMDADLVGLKSHHVKEMLDEYENSDADIILGVFHNGRLNTDISQKLNPHLSGQRVVSKEIFNHLKNSQIKEFGVEIAMTKLALKKGLKMKRVNLNGVTHIMKEEKRGFGEGLKSRLQMYMDIVRAVFSRS